MRVLAGIILYVISSISQVLGHESPEHTCGAGYPSTFPCIGHGKLFEPQTDPLGVGYYKSINVIAYSHPHKEVFDILIQNAERLQWKVQSQYPGEEQNGIRYRAELEQEGQRVSLSVYEKHAELYRTTRIITSAKVLIRNLEL